MIRHYLKVAFRNLWKYRAQSIISIAGLAVGFTCFSLATLWIRYEMTYDHFHRNAGQMYVLSKPDNINPNEYQRINPYPLAGYLKKTFPEIINACNIIKNKWPVKVDNAEVILTGARIDSAFLDMFDIKIIEGSPDFTISGSAKVAVTEEKGRELFGDESALGKTISVSGAERTICAIVSGYSKHSNYPFEMLEAYRVEDNWNASYYETLIELAPGTDAERFAEKLHEHTIKGGGITIKGIKMTPLTSLRYEDPIGTSNIKFHHIVLFCLSGALVILCSLFNYLTLFVSRFRIREKELALRMVCGASGRSLFLLLSTELLLNLLLASGLYILLLSLLHEPFQTLSEIQMSLSFYWELFLYIGTIIVLSLFAFGVILALFKRHSLHTAIRRSKHGLFRKLSVVSQLIISIGFLFCTTVMLKQVYFLRTTDLGFKYQNTASWMIWSDEIPIEVMKNQLQQIPGISEIIQANQPLLPLYGQTAYGISNWDEKPSEASDISILVVNISKEYAGFYDFQLIAGEMLSDDEPANNTLINEAAAKAFGWDKPVGKNFGGKHVKGVIKDIYSSSPTVPVLPTLYRHKPFDSESHCVLFKYPEGEWKECKEKIEQWMKKEYPDMISFAVVNAEDAYTVFLKSEDALLKLLSFVSAVCVVICVFGFVSMITLSCEEQRKEIAIRKINGATMKNILTMYFKSYFLLLLTGAVIAFPVGYFIMKRWMEQYVRQTTIGVWIYLSILLALTGVIVLCVGWRVYKASVENPAEVIKS